MNISKTTTAAIIIIVSWLTSVFFVYTGKAAFNDAAQAFVAILTLATGWGLFSAKDDKPNTPQ